MMPVRIQRKRTKGWRMPPNAVSVTRTGPFGNPFIVAPHIRPGAKVSSWGYIAVPTVEDAIECFRLMVPQRDGFIDQIRDELRGKDLACWCAIGSPCHADILLEIANSEQEGSGPKTAA